IWHASGVLQALLHCQLLPALLFGRIRTESYAEQSSRTTARQAIVDLRRGVARDGRTVPAAAAYRDRAFRRGPGAQGVTGPRCRCCVDPASESRKPQGESQLGEAGFAAAC